MPNPDLFKKISLVFCCFDRLVCSSECKAGAREQSIVHTLNMIISAGSGRLGHIFFSTIRDIQIKANAEGFQCKEP